tara:strand:- start:1082 stop:1927 length:846 start_codon:yes stop_codon:yes gene_type:complete
VKKTFNLKSIFFLLVSSLCFSVLGGLIKYASVFFHAFEQAFFRNVFSIFLLIPILSWLKVNPFNTGKKKLLIIRSIFGGITMLLLFWSYTLIPLSQAMAISFSTPLFTFLGSVLFFKEKPSKDKYFTLSIGFLFVIAITRPDVTFEIGTLIALLAAITHSITALIVKKLTQTESVLSIMFFMVLLMTPITIFPALSVWKTPDELFFMFLFLCLALVGTLGNYFWTKSISLAQMTTIMPFDFSKLIFAIIIGFYFFDEKVDLVTFISGCGLIICNLIIVKSK